MPRTIKVYDEPRKVATEDELLAFANAIREAGGADPLDALLPSVPSNTKKCLIANALNFGCEVEPNGNESLELGTFKSGAERWIMKLPANLTKAQRAALGKVPGVRLRRHKDVYAGVVYDDFYYLTLPEHIGGAAEAFDVKAAFTEYRKPA